MKRRQFVALSASTTCPCLALAGCTAEDIEEETETQSNTNPESTEAGEEPEDPEPEPEGGDAKPYTHYELEINDERQAGQPVWLDQNERMYGRDGARVIVSDDWWQTGRELYSFADEIPDGERVETIVVPESGNVLVGVGGRSDKTTGRLELLNDDFSGSETLYEFDWGRTASSMGHVVYNDIVVIAAYGRSDFEGGNHPNEVILSTDGGESFELVLEPETVDEEAANNHIHDVEYDPYAERVWVAVGDHGNSQIYWSDDLGESWEELTERGGVAMITQVAAFEENVVFGTDSTPEGIILWERDGPDDEPVGTGDLERVHVQIETDPDDDTMEMYARRRWHLREGEGRELCLVPFGYSPMHETAADSVVLASVDGNEWYELHRTETREILLTNIMGPLSMDGDRRMLVSDSSQGDGHQIDATIPEFWT